MKHLWVVLLVSACTILAQATYLWEDFNDGDADGWVEWPDYLVASYEVTDSLTYHMHYIGSDSEWALAYWDVQMPSSDYTMLMDFVAYSPTSHVGIDGRLDLEGPAYVAYAHYYSDILVIGKYNNGWTTLDAYSFNFAWGTHYRMKFRVESNVLYAKAWEMGSAEPVNWQVAATDNDLAGPGYIGLECGHNPSGSFSAEFDNILVAEYIPTALQQTTWGMIKAAF